MKPRLLSLLAATVILVGCSNQEALETSTPMPETQKVSNIRSYDEAMQIAQSSISMLNASGTTRSTIGRKIDLEKTKIYATRSKTRATASDTIFYVFNFEDNQGFAIVSARKSQSLLAIAEEGSYDPNEEQESKAFEYVMELAKQYVLSAEDTNGRHPFLRDPVGQLVDEYTYQVLSSAGNYITLKWGETGIEASQCSNGYVGSSNLATAMLLGYYTYPTSIDLNYPGMNCSNYYLDWTEMKKHVVGHPASLTNCIATTSAHNSIAYLCRQIGKFANSTYGSLFTSTSITRIASALDSLGYNCYQLMYNQGLLNQALDLGQPMIVSGECFTRYTWLVDGYQYCAVTVTEMVYYPDGTSEFVSQTSLGNKYYNHINWGMNGEYNGYYLAGVFDISEPRPVGGIGPSIVYPSETDFSTSVLMYYAYPNI